MRQISRPAEGLRASHSPHLFLILPPPPSYVLCIAFSHLTHFVPFSRSATYSLCCLPFSSSRHINPTSCFFSCFLPSFPVLSLTENLFVFLKNIHSPTVGQSHEVWSELKEMAISGGTWQQVKSLKPALL